MKINLDWEKAFRLVRKRESYNNTYKQINEKLSQYITGKSSFETTNYIVLIIKVIFKEAVLNENTESSKSGKKVVYF